MPPHGAKRLFLDLTAVGAVALAGGACVPDAPSSSAPEERFSVTLAWDAPTQDARGRPLDDLAGYRLYYGQTTPLTPQNATVVSLGLVTRHRVENLPAGAYVFAISAMDVTGNESALSEAVSVSLGP